MNKETLQHSSGILLTTWVQTNIKGNLHIHNTQQTRQNSMQSIANMPPLPRRHLLQTHSPDNAQKPQICPVSVKGAP